MEGQQDPSPRVQAFASRGDYGQIHYRGIYNGGHHPRAQRVDFARVTRV